jgi:signal transduction histidine kinase
VAYRIVQESLANATRYAAGSQVRVDVAIAGTELAVTIANTAPTSQAIDLDSDGGLGIPGMIERAKAVGGVLSAAPKPDGGFVVQARLPMRAAGVGDDSGQSGHRVGMVEK